MRPQNTFIKSIALLLTVAVTTAACGSGTGTTTETVATPQDVAPEESTREDPAEPAEPPSGDTDVALVWNESELSGNTYVDDVIATPDGFIAYRADESARAWVSRDGVTWSEADLDFGTANEPQFRNVTSGEAGYLALGSTANSERVLWVSEDGLRWEPYPVDVETPEGDFEGFSEVVSFDGGLLLRGSLLVRDGDEIHSHGVVLAYSEDGVSWEILPDHDTLFGPAAQVGEIVGSGQGLVATGWVESDNGGERIWFSPDGRTWEESPADFLNDPGFYIGSGTVRWGDSVLVVGQSHAGVSIHTTVNGRDWEELASNPLLENTEELVVYAHQVAAGPYGIAIIGQYEPAFQDPPPVTIEKEGFAITVDVMSGGIAVSELATGTLISESNIEDETVVTIDEEKGTVTVLNPKSGEEITSFTFEEFEEAQSKAFEDAGFEDPSYSEPEPPVLFFSPDGQSWSSVSVAEINPSSDFPSAVIVGDDALIVRFPEQPDHEEYLEEEPADLYGDNPDFIWVGRIGGQ